MKFALIALAALCAFVAAEPRSDEIPLRDSRLVTDAIATAIENLSQTIRDAGLDPIIIEKERYSYALPVPAVFSAEAAIDNLLSTGLSNIVIERINFSVLTQRLTMTLALPKVDLSFDNISGQAAGLGHSISGEASGSVAVNGLRVAVNARVGVGVISGISIRNLSIDLYLRSIDSDLIIVVQDRDLSSRVNNLLDTIIPDTISENRADINRLLEIIALELIESHL